MNTKDIDCPISQKSAEECNKRVRDWNNISRSELEWLDSNRFLMNSYQLARYCEATIEKNKAPSLPSITAEKQSVNNPITKEERARDNIRPVAKHPIQRTTGNNGVTPSFHGVYVASNKAMPGLLKIGFTKGRVEDRIKKLSEGSGVPTPFTCEVFISCEFPHKLEQQLHKAFESRQFNKSREFFAVPSSEVLEVALRLLKGKYFQVSKAN